MTYKQILEYIYGLERFGMKLDLSNTLSILDYLGNPQLKFRSIHIAGTNGKGSTAAMLESILCKAGYKTGLFTSPHLVDFRERIRICGEMIDEDFISDFVTKLKNRIDRERCTFFEVLTSLAFYYFAHKEIDIAVVETGLGGRLDSTNVLSPLVSVITSISFDHTHILGTRLSQIAKEKGGIIKRGVPTITSVNDNKVLRVLESMSKKKCSPLLAVPRSCQWRLTNSSISKSRFDYQSNSANAPRGWEIKNLSLNLAGKHQVLNAVTTISVLEKLRELGFKISKKAIKVGLRNVLWRARLEVFRKNPLVILDVAHNPGGIEALLVALDELLKGKKLCFIFGAMRDKDYPQMLAQICNKASFIILTKPIYHRALEPIVLEKEVKKYTIHYKTIPSIRKAYLFALENGGKNHAVVVTGSHFTVGEFLSEFDRRSS